MRRLIVAFVEAIKEAFSQAEDAYLNKTLVASALGKVGWIVPLLMYPHLFAVSPYYAAMRVPGGAPEMVWLLAFLCLTFFDCLSVSVRAFRYQVTALVLGSVLWTALSVLIGASSPHGLAGIPAAPGAIIYFIGGLWCAGGAVQRCAKYSADRETFELRRLRTEAIALAKQISDIPRENERADFDTFAALRLK